MRLGDDLTAFSLLTWATWEIDGQLSRYMEEYRRGVRAKGGTHGRAAWGRGGVGGSSHVCAPLARRSSHCARAPPRSPPTRLPRNTRLVTLAPRDPAGGAVRRGLREERGVRRRRSAGRLVEVPGAKTLLMSCWVISCHHRLRAAQPSTGEGRGCGAPADRGIDIQREGGQRAPNAAARASGRRAGCEVGSQTKQSGAVGSAVRGAQQGFQ
ncbi:MAG: hypothetical protein J3K34DRAFT_407840 [Monoraphidium minutum]|nr:MAG: hypothetical protein J3K34DRAFT_407840 [Monoraphidium minutum]